MPIIEGLGRLQAKFQRMQGMNFPGLLAQAASMVETTMKELAPVGKSEKGSRGGKGALQKSISKTIMASEAKIGPNVNYAIFVEKGTKPHVIVGNPILSFIWKGKRAFFRSVNHPGTEAQPFVEPALVQNQTKIDAMFKQMLDISMVGW